MYIYILQWCYSHPARHLYNQFKFWLSALIINMTMCGDTPITFGKQWSAALLCLLVKHADMLLMSCGYYIIKGQLLVSKWDSQHWSLSWLLIIHIKWLTTRVPEHIHTQRLPSLRLIRYYLVPIWWCMVFICSFCLGIVYSAPVSWLLWREVVVCSRLVRLGLIWFSLALEHLYVWCFYQQWL